MGHHGHGDAEGVCNMDHVTFRDNFGGPVLTNSNTGFGRIISFVNDSWTVTLDYVTIRDCIISEKLHGNHYSIGGMGSAIRSQGNVGGWLKMRYCEAYNNTYRDPITVQTDFTTERLQSHFRETWRSMTTRPRNMAVAPT